MAWRQMQDDALAMLLANRSFGTSLRHALLRHNVTFRLVLAFAAAGFVLILTSPPSGTSPGSRRRASRTSRWGR
ncbi:MAG: hypothetical protein KGL48_06575 [Sphingomonadales bacterium]|nr:hypothetical protein [Sphingomonadales bacterium]MDE2568587.1 hypothetical protein [Sphingomonadales bacterium]